MRPPKRPEDPSKPTAPSTKTTRMRHVAFGLSKSEFDVLCKEMMAAVRRMGCPSHIDTAEVVHDAFVMALSKPATEWPQGEKFVGWMCTLAEYAALTNRKSKHRRLLGNGISDEELAELVVAPEQADDPLVRDALRAAFAKLDAKDQEVLQAYYGDEKAIIELAREKKRSWSVMNGRYRRALDRLYALVRAILAAIILLVPKNARAHVARWTQRMARRIPQATQTACAMTVTVACGVLVPASSAEMVEAHEVTVAAPSVSLPMLAAVTSTSPPLLSEEVPLVKPAVAPVKPIDVDKPEQQCSAAAMKSTKIASYLQGTVLPFAFLVAPAMTPLACAGGERQAPPPQQPDDEEEEGGPDRYEVYCKSQMLLGADCPSKEAWCAEMGMRPSPKGCK